MSLKKTYGNKESLHALRLYSRFIIIEIPNLIQIFSLITILSFFLQTDSLRNWIIISVSILVWFYLIEKQLLFRREEIINQHSYQNLFSVPDEAFHFLWFYLVVLTQIIFYLLLTKVAESLISSH